MKAEARTPSHQIRSLYLSVLLGICTPIVGSVNSRADGCFVVPKFVWDKQRDINEPAQKAIITYDLGHEELLLQVKYDGPLDEFGWLIPVPNLPTVQKGAMECFYELSKFSQKNMEPPQGANSASLSRGTYGAESEEPQVKVVEIKTVGAYDIAVLSSKDAGSLASWLKTNQFAIPADASTVIDSYVKQNWYFIAVKINLNSGSRAMKAKQLAGGELSPLQIGFASARCVFPLKISSLNHSPSEVQVYVLSPEPLVEPGMFEQDLADNYRWRTNLTAELAGAEEHLRAMRSRSLDFLAALPSLPRTEDHQLSPREEFNPEKTILAARVGQKDIPVCMGQLGALAKNKFWWLLKQTWIFQSESMRDLEFKPAIAVFATKLTDREGILAAANLMRLGTNGVSALLTAMRSTNAVARTHAASFAEAMYEPNDSGRSERFSSVWKLNSELLSLLPALLNDAEPEVRLHAVYAAENSQSPVFFNRMLELARDDYSEISEAALGYLCQQQAELPKHVSLYHEMLRNPNANVQIAGLRLLLHIPNVEIPRAELRPLFSVPRKELAGMAVSYLRQENVSDEEAKLLTHNSLWVVRMMGLSILMLHANNQSVEMAIPLLEDPVEIIRIRAHDALTILTGQSFPADHPQQWENWWEQNKATFKVIISPEELRTKQLERTRQRRGQPGE